MPITQDSDGNTAGSIIKLGAYNWRVLDVQNGKALLLCDRVIEARAFHSADANITWAECELRRYLNGPFLDSFSANDKVRIDEVTTVTNDNPWYGTYGGNATKDRVFLLSVEEVVEYFGDSGLLGNGPPEDKDVIGCIDDLYNASRIAYDEHGIESCWWLRSPARYGSYAALVTSDGEVSLHGPFSDSIFAFGAGVRPALWLSL